MALLEFDTSTLHSGESHFQWSDLEQMGEALEEIIDGLRLDRSSGLLPFLDLPSACQDRLIKLAETSRERFDRLVVLGIGGSALGARAIYEALVPPYLDAHDANSSRRSVWFCENVDPDEFRAMLNALDWERTQFNVVTKSGCTIETWATFLVVREELERRFGPEGAKERLVFTTDPERGALRALAKQLDVETLDVPPKVGGRFSALTPVGLYPAAFAGLDVAKLLTGASRAVERSLSSDIFDNPAAVLAASQILHYQAGRHIFVIMPYAKALLSFSEWLCQLWAESLGKRRGDDRVGPTPVAALGARDQHSQLQLYMEGPIDKNILFLEVSNFSSQVQVPISKDVSAEVAHLGGKDLREILHAELSGVRQALVEEGCPVSTIRLRSLTEESVGALLMLFEVATAIAGALMGVDPYNQPGVELGKRYAHGLLGRTKEAHYAAGLREAESKRETKLIAI
ncbi:MAG: hypothetical protein KC561_04510 [Myxococcales bacterium]|nr:hypothetical protein [Myxococcales bacterium]